MTSSKQIWVEGPLKLIPVPSTYKDVKSHYAVTVASEMANVHNVMIRGLNSILIQGPHIACYGQPGYKEKDVKDLLYYTEAWFRALHHHHETEESVLFPLLEELIGEPGSMDVAVDQHEAFQQGLHDLQHYTTAMQKTPQEHQWAKLQTIIDTFTEPLVSHLEAEVPLMLSLDRTDEAKLRIVLQKTEAAAQASGGISMFYDVFPLIMGCCDKTHPGEEKFPPLPAPLVYAINYWFSWRHSGAWRFNPSNLFRQPRSLQMMGAQAGAV